MVGIPQVMSGNIMSTFGEYHERIQVYRISSFKRCGVYLILGLLGAAFIRGQRLFQKLK